MEVLQNLENHHFIAMIAIAVIALFAIDALQSANRGTYASYTITSPGLVAGPANKAIQANNTVKQNTTPANVTAPATGALVPVIAPNGTGVNNNLSNTTLANASNISSNTSAGNISANNQTFPEPSVTTTENLTIKEPPVVAPKPSISSKVTYYFFWASYCTTCKTMMPMIQDIAKRHPKLIVQMVDVQSGSPYISRFGVTMTAVSIVVREEDGEMVSGTKTSGFMNERQIEALICTELDDDRCDNV